MRVVFTKWDGSLHWHGGAEMLGTDAYGTWLIVRPGTEWRKGEHGDPKASLGSVFLVPDGKWYLASFPLHDPEEELYVDVTTPAEWSDGEVRMVDHDLDILRGHGGHARLLDEDEFDEHRASMAYPPHLVDGARSWAARLMTDVEARREPFGSASVPWEDLVLGRR